MPINGLSFAVWILAARPALSKGATRIQVLCQLCCESLEEILAGLRIGELPQNYLIHLGCCSQVLDSIKVGFPLQHGKPVVWSWLHLVGDPGFASHEQESAFEKRCCVACPSGPLRGLLPSMAGTVTGEGFLACASPSVAP